MHISARMAHKVNSALAFCERYTPLMHFCPTDTRLSGSCYTSYPCMRNALAVDSFVVLAILNRLCALALCACVCLSKLGNKPAKNQHCVHKKWNHTNTHTHSPYNMNQRSFDKNKSNNIERKTHDIKRERERANGMEKHNNKVAQLQMNDQFTYAWITPFCK